MLQVSKVYMNHLASSRHRPNVVLMLVHRLRRWPNIKTTLVQRVVFTEKYPLRARFVYRCTGDCNIFWIEELYVVIEITVSNRQ